MLNQSFGEIRNGVKSMLNQNHGPRFIRAEQK